MRMHLLTWVLLTVNLGLYAQKNELKEIKKAISQKNYSEAKDAIQKYSDVFANTDAKTKETVAALEAEAYMGLVKKDSTNSELMSSAVAVLNKAKTTSKTEGMKQELLTLIQKQAIRDYESKNMVKAALGYENIYRINPKDTIYLYSAASIAVSSPDTYDTALRIYKELVDLGYDGATINYMATNVNTSQEDNFNSDKKTRDLSVIAKTHTNPRDVPEPSKKAEIVKNIALIYTHQGKKDEALAAFKTAREKNPDDVSLIVQEANIYYELNDKEKFKELINQAISKKPNDPDLYYNVGVVNSNLKQFDEAIASYKKVLEIDPKYMNAVINLSGVYIEKGNAVIEKMNEIAKKSKLSKEEDAFYEALKKEKENAYRAGADVVEAALVHFPKNKDLLSQLKNIYGALSDTVNYKRVKALLEQ